LCAYQLLNSGPGGVAVGSPTKLKPIFGGVPLIRASDWRHRGPVAGRLVPPSSIHVYCSLSSAQIVGRMSPCWFFGGP
jgi:hypothetical protein